MNTDPQRTLDLLNELERLGFDNRAFERLHQCSQTERKIGATIGEHRTYCEKTRRFFPDHNNAPVQQRLEIVLERYHRHGRNTPSAFLQLADDSFREIPFLPVSTGPRS